MFKVGDKVILDQSYREASMSVDEKDCAAGFFDMVKNNVEQIVSKVDGNKIWLHKDSFFVYQTNLRHFKKSDTESLKTKTEWTDKHYDFSYQLTKQDIENGFVKVDPYFVARIWQLGKKDDSGVLFHNLKNISRYGKKNSKEREIRALYAQIKRLAELEEIEL